MFNLFRKKPAKRSLPFPANTEYRPEGSSYNIWYIRTHSSGFDVMCVHDYMVAEAGLGVMPNLIHKNDRAELQALLDRFAESGRFLTQAVDDHTHIVVHREVDRMPDHYRQVLDTIYQSKVRP
jgi:hypothetical protein